MNLISDIVGAIAVETISVGDFEANSNIPATHYSWMVLNGFSGQSGQTCIIANSSGKVEMVYFGVGSQLNDDKTQYELADPFDMAHLYKLPAGTYKLVTNLSNAQTGYLAFALAAYEFNDYKPNKTTQKPTTLLVAADNVNFETIKIQTQAIKLTRDLINTPANDMGPAELAQSIAGLANQFGATYKDIIGDKLLDKGFNLIHAVGRASSRPPRFVELNWQSDAKQDLPHITLVGKGVIFDTGGLDLKPAAGMILMKKDMGGAANVIGLAQMIMAHNLPVKLTLLVAAVENSVSSNAFRPSDVLTSYKGLTVEIGNTDAEGRLVLADLLAYGDEAKPDMMIDMATLTGAARVAVGPEIAAFFTDNVETTQTLNEHSAKTDDPIWQLPLYQPYFNGMKSKVADMNNLSSSPMAGATSAALFLKCFVENTQNYIHWDINGWNVSDRPARPVGGEAMGIRAIFSMLQQKYEA